MNDSLMCTLKKVDDKFDYSGIDFHPVCGYSNLLEIYNVCRFIYELDSASKIRLIKQCHIQYLATDLIYLWRTEADNKLNYIRIRNIDTSFTYILIRMITRSKYVLIAPRT